MKKLFLAATLIATWAGLLNAQIPTGLFYLPSSKTISSTALNSANVDGVVAGGSWMDIEQQDGVYTFNSVLPGNGQSLDSTIAQVEAANGGQGKPMRLAISTPPKLRPAWLNTLIANDSYPAAAKYFTYKDGADTVTIPVFWEPTLLARHAALVQAVADHLGTAHPLIKIVYVPFVNAGTNDFNPGSISPGIDGVPPTNSTPVSRWQAAIAAQSTHASFQAALTYAGNYTYAAYRAAFPNAYLTTSIGRIDNLALNPGYTTGTNGNFGLNVIQDVLMAANGVTPGKIILQKNNLNGGGVTPSPGGTTQWSDLYKLKQLGLPVAAQMVWGAYSDKTGCSADPLFPYMAERMNAGTGSGCVNATNIFVAAVNTGISYGTKWQEIYENDILNLGPGNADPNSTPARYDAIGYAHTQLFQGTTYAPPSLTTLPVTNIATTSFSAWATINPNGTPAFSAVDYGLTTSYGSATADSPLGAGTSNINKQTNVTGLTPNTLYNARWRTYNTGGTVLGGNFVVTTLAGPTPTPTATPTPTPTPPPTSGKTLQAARKGLMIPP